MTQPVKWSWKDELNDKLFEIRKHLHQNTELSFQEHETQQYIAKVLDDWGIPYQTITDTGVYVDIEGAEDGKHIALRADIDALPIAEKSDVDFRRRHACLWT